MLDTRWGSNPQQRSSRCILQPQPTGQVIIWEHLNENCSSNEITKYTYFQNTLYINVFQLQFFFLMQNSFIEIILVWEIIKLDKFWFEKKSSSGLVDLAMRKMDLYSLICSNCIMSCDLLKSKCFFVVWETDL